MQRGIRPEMIEATLKSGEIKEFGKNNLKFVKRYRRFDVICVDEVRGERIQIITIERKNKFLGWLK